MIFPTPKVSVLILTYNHKAFIASALESALAQQCEFSYEIVVGNDASTDGSDEVIDGYACKYHDRMRVCHAEQNRGMFHNFAATLARCRGDYIALLEGDDFWTDHRKLQLQADYLDEHPHCAMSFHPVTVCGGPEDRKEFPRLSGLFLNTESLLTENLIPTCSVMFRRAALAEVPAWFEGLGILDWPIYVHLTLAGSADILRRPMGVYRVHPTGSWSQASLRHRYLKVVEVLLQFAIHLPSRYLPAVDRALADYLKALSWQNQVERHFAPLPGGGVAWMLARRRHFQTLCVVTRWNFKRMFLQAIAFLSRSRPGKLAI